MVPYSNGIVKVIFWQSFVIKKDQLKRMWQTQLPIFQYCVLVSLHRNFQRESFLNTYYVCALDKKMWSPKLSVELCAILKDNLCS